MSSQGALEKTFKCATCDKWIHDIVELIDHDCDQIIPADALSSNEKSTLLYIEARIVDNQATLDRSQMNREDDQNIKLFTAAGLLEVDETKQQVTSFTDCAWELAATLRKERGQKNL